MYAMNLDNGAPPPPYAEASLYPEVRARCQRLPACPPPPASSPGLGGAESLPWSGQTGASNLR